MQHLEVSGALRYIYIYIYIYVFCVIRRLNVKIQLNASARRKLLIWEGGLTKTIYTICV